MSDYKNENAEVLKEDKPIVSNEDSVKSTRRAECRYCGAKMDNDTNVCKYCGKEN